MSLRKLSIDGVASMLPSSQNIEENLMTTSLLLLSLTTGPTESTASIAVVLRLARVEREEGGSQGMIFFETNYLVQLTSTGYTFPIRCQL